MDFFVLLTKCDYMREQTGLLCLKMTIKFMKKFVHNIKCKDKVSDLMVMSNSPVPCCVSLCLPDFFIIKSMRKKRLRTA